MGKRETHPRLMHFYVVCVSHSQMFQIVLIIMNGYIIDRISPIAAHNEKEKYIFLYLKSISKSVEHI